MTATTKEKKYYPAIGRRKTARARIRLYSGKKGFKVNEKDWLEFFPQLILREIVQAPLKELGIEGKFGGTILVRGGGIRAQAEAVRLGISRALIKFNPEWRTQLKAAGYLSRDPRMKERKKYGLKRARRAAQWQKR
jgi:small subunit ribosomal protein S9